MDNYIHITSSKFFVRNLLGLYKLIIWKGKQEIIYVSDGKSRCILRKYIEGSDKLENLVDNNWKLKAVDVSLKVYFTSYEYGKRYLENYPKIFINGEVT